MREDFPVGHPDFGRLTVCQCRQGEVSEEVAKRLYELSNLDALSHLTFETFQPRGKPDLEGWEADSVESAFNYANRYAQSLEGWLLLEGKYGCGKTHLAAAIANQVATFGVPTIFLTAPDLLDWLRYAYQSQEVTFEERFEEIRNVKLLILDDFGTHNATEWAQEKIFQILNFRYINKLSTVITTNVPLELVEGRIRSRLQHSDYVHRYYIKSPDFRRSVHEAENLDLSSLAIHKRKTFDNFSLRSNEGLTNEQQQSLNNALMTANDYAKDPEGWLLLSGTYSSGKTHLAAAIANYRAAMGDIPLFVEVSDLFTHLRSTFGASSTSSYDRRFEEVKTARLLILDDLVTQHMTPWVRENIYKLINYRYNTELPTVITTTETAKEMDARLLSRLQDERLCIRCAITAPSFRGKGQAKRKKR